MTTFYIVQPMEGKSDEQIREERSKCQSWLFNAFESITIIDDFIEEPAPKDCKKIFVWSLGEAIKRISRADVLVLWGNWEDDERCTIEKVVADKCGMPIIQNRGEC